MKKVGVLEYTYFFFANFRYKKETSVATYLLMATGDTIVPSLFFLTGFVPESFSAELC